MSDKRIEGWAIDKLDNPTVCLTPSIAPILCACMPTNSLPSDQPRLLGGLMPDPFRLKFDKLASCAVETTVVASQVDKFDAVTYLQIRHVEPEH